jgi:hypothetical protein
MNRTYTTSRAHTTNRTRASMLLAVALCVSGARAFADDSMTHVTPTTHQMMKDCMERQKATDVTQSKAQMKRICKDQLKQQKQTGVPAEPVPTDTPHD